MLAVVVAAVSASGFGSGERVARADDAAKGADKPGPEETELVDGAGGCDELVTRNERETRAWERTRPPVPYEYPRQDRFLGAPWPPFGRAAGQASAAIVATLVPHLNAALRDAIPEAGISWPWSFPIGPALSCSRAPRTLDVSRYKPLRLMLEPGMLFGDKIALFVRPAARVVVHPSAWVVGVGGGLGSMIELSGSEPKRASVSPEALIQFGTCCQPGYVILTLRREVFFAGKTQLTFATVGFTYF